LQYLDRNGEFLTTLVDGFIQETESLARDLQQATEARDGSTYRDCLYALKGSAANIGASQLHQLCRQALAADAGGGDIGCSDWLARIRQCIRLTHETLLDSGVMAREPQHPG
ncbi:MAG: Hpt domain-containing protein, partial [Gammaproteobacteria bacterium]